MRILVLGGAFNPMHIGHLMLAEELAAEFSYDKIVLVPSLIPPHKTLVDDPGADARLAMARGAVAGNPLFIVDDCELSRGGISYTVDTLERVVAAYCGDDKPGLAIGDDLAGGFGSWRDPLIIAARADLIVAKRGGIAPTELAFPHKRAHNAALAISSSDIRQRIASGKPWRWLVPAFVAEYIEIHGFYGNR